MSTTWTGTVNHGGGTWDFRLEVEGWPDEWVTNARITHASGADGRSVYPGLSYEGIQISERAVLPEAKLYVDGNTFQINSASHRDEAMASLSKRVDPTFWLDTSITDTSTTVVLKGSQTLATGSYYHLATEAIQSSTGNTVVREVWGTTAQEHNTTIRNLSTIDAALQSVPIYTHPPTMQGRRAFLYAYGKGDSVTGNGTIIWRGVVSDPPMLDDDGITWLINVDPITQVLNQDLPGKESAVRPVGIYHHNECAFYLRITVNSTFDDTQITGFHPGNQEFDEAVNSAITTLIATVDASNTYVSSLTYSSEGVRPHFILTTATTQADGIIVEGGSAIDGWASPTVNMFEVDSGKQALPYQAGTGDPVSIATSTSYIIPLAALESTNFSPNGLKGVFMDPVMPIRSCLGPAQVMPNDWIRDAQRKLSDTTNTPWRIFIDTDITGAETIQINDVPGGQLRSPNGMYEVTTTYTESGVFVVEVSPEIADGTFDFHTDASRKWSGGQLSFVSFNGFLSGDTAIRPARLFGASTNVAGFVTNTTFGVVANAKYANDGSTPYVLGSAAFNNGDVGGFTMPDRVPVGVNNRKYLLTTPKRLEEIIQEELKLAGMFMHLDATGRIAADPLPFVSATQLSGDTVTTDTIVTPADGYGAWPRYEPQRDGLVNKVVIEHGYDPFEDDWLLEPFEVNHLPSIAEHKNRGQGAIKIAPYSHVATDRGGVFELEDAKRVAWRLLSFFGSDYAVVTVEVSLKLFNVLVGDLVLLTSPHVPAGDGTRGVTNKRATVIERRWELDPARFRGELTLLVQEDNGGYTPSARVTSQVLQSGNQWLISCSDSNTFNQAWRQSSAYTVLDHFAAGQYVRVVKWDDTGETQVTGVVDSVPSSVNILVTFDSPWTPSTDTWDLIWQTDTGSTATTGQRSYCYVADTTLKLTDGSGARTFK